MLKFERSLCRKDEMRRFYFRFRIGLLTLTLGLASVYIFKSSNEIEVNLPEFQSDTVIFVTPKRRLCMPGGGGSHQISHSKEFIHELVKEWRAECLEKKSIKSE
jgi:hypothetical protein